MIENKRKSEVNGRGGQSAGPPSAKKLKQREGNEGNSQDAIPIGGKSFSKTLKVEKNGSSNIKKGAVNNRKKKQLSGIVTEAKANHQLLTDKKTDKKEKAILINSTYNLVKDHIAEMSRIKGMGKILASLLSNRKETEIFSNILKCFRTTESKLLLLKSNGYKLAIKLIRIGPPEVKQDFVKACLSNPKGVRALMNDFKTARVLPVAYEHGTPEARALILSRLVLGNMPLSKDGASLSEVFSNCKADVVEGCRTFLQSALNEKSIKYEVIQDVLAICLETSKSTGMDVEEFVNFAGNHVVALCNRSKNSTAPLWVVWLSTAQTRKHIMKSIKGKIVSLLQSYNGRMFVMALFESTDDTKALEKFVLKEFLDSLEESVLNVEVRKLLEFLLVPRSTKFMHPKEIEILRLGDDVKTSKKSNEVRFEEVRKSLEKPVLSALKNNHENWLKDNKLCLLVIAIVERFGTAFDGTLMEKISKTLHSSGFSERVSDKAVRMVLESFLSADISRYEADSGAALFINSFVPNLGETHVKNLVSHCPRLIVRLVETSAKVEPALTFKLKKSWLMSETSIKAQMKWKHQETESSQAKTNKNRKRKQK